MNPEQDGRQIDIPPLRETAAADAFKRAGLIGRMGSIALGLVVATMLAGGGFFYGLDIGRRTAPMAEPPLVRADPAPIKERPEDPGGLEVPFQDRLVFDGVRDPVLRPGEAALAEPAEQPLAAPPADEGDAGAASPGGTGVVVVEPDRIAAAPAMPPPPPLPEEALPAPAPQPRQTGPIVIQGADIAAADTAPEPAKPVELAPQPLAEPAPVAAPQPAAPAPPVQLAAAPAPIRIQVGAYRSEAGALNGWNLLATAHRELLAGLKPAIVEIDLGPGRGVFHRLQAGPLADRQAAAALCDALRAREQGCLVVRP